MQKQYDAIVAQNKGLQSELRLASKMIELIINSLKKHSMDCNQCKSDCFKCKDATKTHFKLEAIKELGE